MQAEELGPRLLAAFARVPDVRSRHGRRYYPKLLVAVPFTPATGPRLLVRAGLDPGVVARHLLEALQDRRA